MRSRFGSSLRADRVRRSLDEGLHLQNVLLRQFAREVGHTLIDERTVENEVLQVLDRLFGYVAEVPDNAAVVDGGDTMADSAGAHVDQLPLGNVLRIVIHALHQTVGLI